MELRNSGRAWMGVSYDAGLAGEPGANIEVGQGALEPGRCDPQSVTDSNEDRVLRPGTVCTPDVHLGQHACAV